MFVLVWKIKADAMSEFRKLAAILAIDVVGYSRLAGVDEDRTLARLRTLRSDLVDPTVAVHHGRVVKRTGDGLLVEFRSVVDAVRCAIEVQRGMIERNAGLPSERRIEFRVGIHLGDVVEESDGDLMGDGVNIAARLEGIAKPGTICLSEDAYRQVRARLDLAVSDLGQTQLKNIAEPLRVYALEVGVPVARRQSSGRLVMAAALVVVLIVVGGAFLYVKPFTRTPSREPSSVAQNLARTSEQQPSPSPPIATPQPVPTPPASAPALPPQPAPTEQTKTDETAWSTAMVAATPAAFRDYLRAFPAGAHAAQAQQHLAAQEPPPSATISSAASFDGTWTTVVSCPAAEGAGSFTLLVDADVKAGVFSGEKGDKGKPGWYSLNGKVQPDGTVEIFARGIVPSSRLAAGNVPVGTPYGYPIAGRLEGAQGTGARQGGRPCSVTFTKQ
jgi:class 3 adenylate cyclase